MIEAGPENLIGDRAYDSDPLDEELRNDGIEMIAPHRNPIPTVTSSCSNCIIASWALGLCGAFPTECEAGNRRIGSE